MDNRKRRKRKRRPVTSAAPGHYSDSEPSISESDESDNSAVLSGDKKIKKICDDSKASGGGSNEDESEDNLQHPGNNVYVAGSNEDESEDNLQHPGNNAHASISRSTSDGSLSSENPDANAEQEEQLNDSDSEREEGNNSEGEDETIGDNVSSSDEDGVSSSDKDDVSSVGSRGSVGSVHSADSRRNSDEEMDSVVEGDTEEEDEMQFDQGNVPLYDGAPLTLKESLLAILTLATSEHLSGKVISKILQLVALHCPINNVCKKTLYSFKKFFATLGNSILVFHYFCSTCIFPLATKESRCAKCKKEGNVSFFIQIPLLNQLQSLFLKEDFYNHLQGRFNPNRKKNDDDINDMYDGRVYKREMEEGFLSNPNNISFMFYSDGVQVFKSSSFGIWPLCLVINELPYKERIQQQNILLVGLWFGNKKPSANVFLRPLYEEFQAFTNEGYNLRLFDGSRITVKGKIICATCDLPAKSIFLCFKYFNGYYGCCRCLSQGDRYQLRKTTIHVHPYSNNVPLRTHNEVKEMAAEALAARVHDPKASVKGVKGLSILYHLLPDIICCTGVDVLHELYLGIAKLLTYLWFDSSFSRCSWSLSHLMNVIDDRLKKIKPPKYVQRAPRSLTSLKQWKGAEFKLFLLYYSVPLLLGVMEREYLEHHSKLVSAAFLLSQESITAHQLNVASELLHSYVANFARLYSLRYLGMNVHLLTHLPDVVRDLGPLWVYSCFFLEGYNGKIVKLFHGTQHVALQICSSITMFTKMPQMISNLPQDSVIYKFCRELTFNSAPLKVAEVIDGDTYAIGKYSCPDKAVKNSKEIIEQSLHLTGSCKIFYRLKKHRVIYHSSEYGRVSIRKESSFVLFSDNDNDFQVGQVIRFVQLSTCDCEQLCDRDQCSVHFLAIIRKYERKVWFAQTVQGLRLSFISNVQPSNNVIAISVQNIKVSCFYFKINQEEYIARPINTFEVE